MARGRQQKWICLDCGAAFAVQGIAPKMCCACGSATVSYTHLTLPTIA